MTLTACEITWLHALLKDMALNILHPAVLKCDNIVALSIASSLVLHERTKYIEVDNHFVRDTITEGSISTEYVPTPEQIAYS